MVKDFPGIIPPKFLWSFHHSFNEAWPTKKFFFDPKKKIFWPQFLIIFCLIFFFKKSLKLWWHYARIWDMVKIHSFYGQNICSVANILAEYQYQCAELFFRNFPAMIIIFSWKLSLRIEIKGIQYKNLFNLLQKFHYIWPVH